MERFYGGDGEGRELREVVCEARGAEEGGDVEARVEGVSTRVRL